MTSAPNDFQTLANSTPMTPPPSTTTLAGTWSRVSAWSLVITRPPISRPGSERAYGAGREDDVAALDLPVADLDGVGGDEPALALDDRDLVRLGQALQPLVEARRRRRPCRR